jgi:hypothetical protein
MDGQLTTDAAALRLFFTDDIYLVNSEEQLPPVKQEALNVTPSAVIQAPSDAVPAEIVFKYLGKNQKNVLILVNDGQYEVSTDAGKELLRNIVKAIQLSANDFALLNYSGYEQVKFPELAGFFSSRLVMAFGVTALQLGLPEHPKNVLVKQESTQFVFSDNLDLLVADQQGKKTLWTCLKQLTI